MDGFTHLLQGGTPSPKGAQADIWARIHRIILAKPGLFRVQKVESHLGAEGINLGLISVWAEHFNRHADDLATAGARLHALDPAIINDAKWRHKFAAVLHSTAVAIYDQRHFTLPLPHRRGGYTRTELRRMDRPNILLERRRPGRGPQAPVLPVPRDHPGRTTLTTLTTLGPDHRTSSPTTTTRWVSAARSTTTTTTPRHHQGQRVPAAVPQTNLPATATMPTTKNTSRIPTLCPRHAGSSLPAPLTHWTRCHRCPRPPRRPRSPRP